MKRMMNYTLSAVTCLSMNLAPFASSQAAKLEQYASVKNMKLTSGTLLMDNDASFEAKLSVLKNAQKGDTVRLVYYIYSDDESASVFTQEVIAAAQRGAKVKLLVDFLQNYKRLDLFKMMIADGSGNVDVRLYGRPTRNIVLDAAYMAANCDVAKGCSDETIKAIDQTFAKDSKSDIENNITTKNTGGSGLFLSGLYGKNPEIMAMALLESKEGIIANLQQLPKKETTQEDKEKLKKFVMLLWDAKMGGPFEAMSARVQLWFATLLYGDQIKPVMDHVTAFIPYNTKDSKAYGQSKENRGKDWAHLTDYTHHKLAMKTNARGEVEYVNGGRNIENSYHMKKNDLTAKYIFMDTDFHATARDPKLAREMEKRFDDLFNFKQLSATIADVDQTMPNDVLANYELAVKECFAPRATELDALKSQGNRAKASAIKKDLTEKCAKPLFATKVRTVEDRVQAARDNMIAGAQAYSQQYQAVVKNEDVIELSARDLKTAQIHYLENLNFTLGNNKQRVYGAEGGQTVEAGKGIHEAWIQGLEKACRTKQDVVLHSAYFFLPGNLLAKLSQMVDGTLDCGQTTVSVMTNSIQTTDLTPINVLNYNAMKSFYEYMNRAQKDNSREKSRMAKFKYYEYDAAELNKIAGATTGKKDGNLSLHTKLSVLGQDIIVGSANADIRSYAMDTNNATLIVGAKDLVTNYKAWLKNIVDTGVAKEVSYLFNQSREDVYKMQGFIVQEMKKRYLGEEKRDGIFSDENIKKMTDRLVSVLENIDSETVHIVPDARAWAVNQMTNRNGTAPRLKMDPKYTGGTAKFRFGNELPSGIKLPDCAGVSDSSMSTREARECSSAFERVKADVITGYDSAFKLF